MSSETSRHEIEQLGKFGLIRMLSEKFGFSNTSSIYGIGEDASVVKPSESDVLLSSKLFLENIHFDLAYFPLRHLGYKCVSVAISDIAAMNGFPYQIRMNIAVSNRFSIEAMEEFMEGVNLCCKRYNTDLIGLDVQSSLSGMVVAVDVFGEAGADRIITRSGAGDNDLLCVSGDFGAAYTGLLLLEREKKVFQANPDAQPELSGYDYVLERELKPEPRLDILRQLEESDLLPTSMINVSDGLASALIQLCDASGKGCQIYESRIPIDPLTFRLLKDFNIVATTVALNGGEDYELLFTVRQDEHEKIQSMENISIIGYMQDISGGRNLVTNDDRVILLSAQGFGG